MKAQLRVLVDSRWFHLADLLFVLASGVSWMLIPKYAIWLTLTALLLLAFRWLGEGARFHLTPIDGLLAIILITAWVGYWAAYDKTAAWIKVWLIVSAVLLYYALSSQPVQNLGTISLASYGCAVGLSIYFLLTSDFAEDHGSVIAWWVRHRPSVHWPAIHPGDLAGLLLLSSIFALYWLSGLRGKSFGGITIFARLLSAFGIVPVLGAIQLAMPGGILAMGISVLAVLVLWMLSAPAGWMAKTRLRDFFPVLVLLGLAALVVLVYLGPARTSDEETSGSYGNGTHTQLIMRAAYFLRDYPITGSGLDSFPGNYSQYMLVIPYYYYADSDNLLLDVAIEQGLIGGAAFMLVFIVAIWLVSSRIISSPDPNVRLFSCLSLLVLMVTVVHGLFYDYLYQGKGTLFLLFPVGMAMMGGKNSGGIGDTGNLVAKFFPAWGARSTRAGGLILILISLTILALYRKEALSVWYADLGAVQMSQAELKGFPTNGWVGAEMVPALESAQGSLRAAIAYDPSNATANYRLGLVSMLSGDFPAASKYLELAHAREPNHRGIIKSLGYCDIWLGKLDDARSLLVTIPEAKMELGAYFTWWTNRGRPDLAQRAFLMASRLESSSP